MCNRRSQLAQRGVWLPFCYCFSCALCVNKDGQPNPKPPTAQSPLWLPLHPVGVEAAAEISSEQSPGPCNGTTWVSAGYLLVDTGAAPCLMKGFRIQWWKPLPDLPSSRRPDPTLYTQFCPLFASSVALNPLTGCQCYWYMLAALLLGAEAKCQLALPPPMVSWMFVTLLGHCLNLRVQS